MPPNTSQVLSRKNLEKRAKAKYITDIISFPLGNLRSVLSKQYKLSQACAGELTELPGKVTGKYCGCRWCLVCSRIRTSRLILGYMPAIEAMSEKWFLTLSRPNVKGPRLKEEIKYYLKTAALINRYIREKTHFKKNKYNSQPKYSSLRKIECTYNEVVNTYHPHFHFIFDNEAAAQMFLNQWLMRNPTAKLDKGNQLKRADNDSAMEMFKYFTKVVSKSKSGKPGDYSIHLQALDTMFVAMRAVRTFQPCGVIKAVSEEIEPVVSEITGRDEINTWAWIGNDWINADTAELLTNWTPSAAILDIKNHVVTLGANTDNSPKLGALPASTFEEGSSSITYETSSSVLLGTKKGGSQPATPSRSRAVQSTMFEALAVPALQKGMRTPQAVRESSSPTSPADKTS